MQAQPPKRNRPTAQVPPKRNTTPQQTSAFSKLIAEVDKVWPETAGSGSVESLFQTGPYASRVTPQRMATVERRILDGRQTERVELFCDSIELGMDFATAALHAEFRPREVTSWISEGRRYVDERPNVLSALFFRRVSKAYASLKARNTGVIAQAAAKDWRVASKISGPHDQLGSMLCGETDEDEPDIDLSLLASNFVGDVALREQKCVFLRALEKSQMSVSRAARLSGINRGLHYLWTANDEGYRNAIPLLRETITDMVETCFMSNIRSGNVNAQIYYLKTIGKNRGYGESSTVALTGEHGGPVAATLSIDGRNPVKPEDLEAMAREVLAVSNGGLPGDV